MKTSFDKDEGYTDSIMVLSEILTWVGLKSLFLWHDPYKKTQGMSLA